MTLTTIPIQTETRNKLREFVSKFETGDHVLNRLYDNAVTILNANVFFSNKSMSVDEALKEIDKW